VLSRCEFDLPGIRRLQLGAKVAVTSWDRDGHDDLKVVEWSFNGQPKWVGILGEDILVGLPLPEDGYDDFEDSFEADWNGEDIQDPEHANLTVRVYLYYSPECSSHPEEAKQWPSKFHAIFHGGVSRLYEITDGKLCIDGKDVGIWCPDELEEFYVCPVKITETGH
jgi:hypothetical protein